jgi:hypothetical protein
MQIDYLDVLTERMDVSPGKTSISRPIQTDSEDKDSEKKDDEEECKEAHAAQARNSEKKDKEELDEGTCPQCQSEPCHCPKQKQPQASKPSKPKYETRARSGEQVSSTPHRMGKPEDGDIKIKTAEAVTEALENSVAAKTPTPIRTDNYQDTLIDRMDATFGTQRR